MKEYPKNKPESNKDKEYLTYVISKKYKDNRFHVARFYNGEWLGLDPFEFEVVAYMETPDYKYNKDLH